MKTQTPFFWAVALCALSAAGAVTPWLHSGSYRWESQDYREPSSHIQQQTLGPTNFLNQEITDFPQLDGWLMQSGVRPVSCRDICFVWEIGFQKTDGTNYSWGRTNADCRYGLSYHPGLDIGTRACASADGAWIESAATTLQVEWQTNGACSATNPHVVGLVYVNSRGCEQTQFLARTVVMVPGATNLVTMPVPQNEWWIYVGTLAAPGTDPPGHWPPVRIPAQPRIRAMTGFVEVVFPAPEEALVTLWESSDCSMWNRASSAIASGGEARFVRPASDARFFKAQFSPPPPRFQ